MQPLDKIPQLDFTIQYAAIEDEVIQTVLEVLRFGAYILDPAVKSFESAMAGYLGSKHAIGVANGSDTLPLALQAPGTRSRSPSTPSSPPRSDGSARRRCSWPWTR